jgi:hypothetical protein
MATTSINVLDNEECAPIIRDRARICQVAGIQPRFIQESMMNHCTPDEVEWVVDFWTHKKNGEPGIVLLGMEGAWIHCQAIAGALVRNYIDARVMSLHVMLDSYVAGQDMTVPHVLLIPNFFVVSERGNLSEWKVQVLLDLLLARTLRSRMNVLGVENMTDLKTEYGNYFFDSLRDYQHITG